MKMTSQKNIATCALSATLFLAAAAPSYSQTFIDTGLVGDAGNANDSTGFGGVGYDYHIGTYEVTNNQYVTFLNSVASSDPHGLYNTSMDSSTHGGITRSGSSGSYTYSTKSGFANKPVNYVSFFDAARFTNWMTTGDTETGVYDPTNSTTTRDATFWNNGGVAIASENEWYKAAYYDGAGGYFLYPTQSNSITIADANYDDGTVNSVGTVTDVGTYAAALSHYGTFDQGGNVWEWNDDIESTSDRGLRGGRFNDHDGGMTSPIRFSFDPINEFADTGFRVTSLSPIPEPSSALLSAFGVLAVLLRRRR